MSEENNNAPEANEFTPITSQDDLEKVLGKRLERERSKFADYDALKEKASRFDELEEANKTELQKAREAAQAAEERASRAEQAAIRADVAAAKGVPAAALTGSSKEEFEASADALLAWRGDQSPQRPSPTGLKSGSAGGSAAMTPKERAAAAAAALRSSN